MNGHTTHPDATRAVPPAGTLRIVAIAAGVISLIGLIAVPLSFWPGYLVAALYWLGVSLGCLGIALIHRTSGGRWGLAIGRQLYAGLGSVIIGLAAVAIVAIGSHHLFPWVSHDAAHHELNHNQQIYFSVPFVIARFVGFGLLWLLFGAGLTKRYRQTAGHPEVPVPAGMAPLSLLIFFTIGSFFTFDAIMSITPGWSSSMFPLIQLMSYGITAMAMCIIVRSRVLPAQNETETRLTHDLGNLLQAFNLLWTYLSFSQFLIIWSGDLPFEVDWYAQRRTPLGGVISVGLFLLHFVVPFTLLLSKDLKRDPRRLARVAMLLMVMCLVDNSWTVLPSCGGAMWGKLSFTLICWLGIGAVWCLYFLRKYNNLPVSLVPIDEHELEHDESAAAVAHPHGGAH